MVLSDSATGVESPPAAPQPPARGRRLLLLGLVILLVAVAGGAFVLLRDEQGDRRTAQARATLEAYLAAWSAGDHAGMAAQSDQPEALVRQVEAPVRTALLATSLEATPESLERVDGTATATYSARWGLDGLGGWSYEGSLQLFEGDDDVWRVRFSPTAVHPGLTDGRSLGRTSVAAPRGRLLARDGTPLRGASVELDSNLLGSVGPLDQEQADAAGPAFAPGDVGGQTGLERAYDALLGGDPGGTVVLLEGRRTVSTLATYPAKPGSDVTTTIDLATQRAAESAAVSTGYPSAVVAVDATTGGVLAIANGPLGGYARAVRGAYPPGSSFKIVTATAGLLAGLTPDSPLTCPRTRTVGGFPFKNSEDAAYGPLTLHTAFAVSCNTAFVELRQELTDEQMQAAVDLYGFDGEPPLPINSVGGRYPTPDGPVLEAAAGFGQAQVTSSPLHMASVAAAVAGGTWHRPFVVGAPSESHPLPPPVAAGMRQMMRAVVTEGTAAPVIFPGEVAGKTGTAEYGTARPGEDLPAHAWFVGYRGTIAFAVLAEGGGYGAEVAAPAAAQFLRALDNG